jgi:hypothetical protein
MADAFAHVLPDRAGMGAIRVVKPRPIFFEPRVAQLLGAYGELGLACPLQT